MGQAIGLQFFYKAAILIVNTVIIPRLAKNVLIADYVLNIVLTRHFPYRMGKCLLAQINVYLVTPA